MTGTRSRLFILALSSALLLAAGLPSAGAGAALTENGTPEASLCGLVQGAAIPSDATEMPVGTPDNTTVDGIEFDLVFIDMMTMHHESAVVMAQVALDRAEHDEIRQLATAIIATQTDEIAQLRAWREAWYPGADELPTDQMNAIMTESMATMLDMPGMEGHGTTMAGMDVSSALIELCLAAEPFDLAFIDEMIPHHESAVQMANIGLEYSSHAELQALQLAIIDGQQAEIDQMRTWRAAWYPDATQAP